MPPGKRSTRKAGLQRATDRYGRDLSSLESGARQDETRFGERAGAATAGLETAEGRLDRELREALGQERGAVDRFSEGVGNAIVWRPSDRSRKALR